MSYAKAIEVCRNASTDFMSFRSTYTPELVEELVKLVHDGCWWHWQGKRSAADKRRLDMRYDEIMSRIGG